MTIFAAENAFSLDTEDPMTMRCKPQERGEIEGETSWRGVLFC
jgi:hypothetical protein